MKKHIAVIAVVAVVLTFLVIALRKIPSDDSEPKTYEEIYFRGGTVVATITDPNDSDEQQAVLTEIPASQLGYYEQENGTIIILDYRGLDTEVEIPSKIDGKRVVAIGDSAFSNSRIVTIKLPEYLTKIGCSAFARCENLKKVIFNDNLVRIEDNAFSGCTSLNNVELPDGLTKICEFAFSDCTSLETISIPNDTVLENDVFFNCNNLITTNSFEKDNED